MVKKRNFGSIRISNEDANDLIIILVKSMNKTIFKATCSVNNKKKIIHILKTLELKGFIDLSNLKKEEGWF